MPKLKKIEPRQLKIFLIALILSGCATLTPGCKKGPDIDELCILNGDGSAMCHSDTGANKKPSLALVNYVAVSPENYQRLLEWGRGRIQVQNLEPSDKSHWELLEDIGSGL